MNDEINSFNNESSLEDLLSSLESLIDEIHVGSVQRDDELDPNDVFLFEFLSEDTNEATLINKTEIFLQILKEVSFPGDVLQYSRITEKMFDNKHVFDGVENISEKILVTATTNFSEMIEKDSKLTKRFYKIIDHIQLASFQTGEISQHYRIESEKLAHEIFQSKSELERLDIEISRNKENLKSSQLELNHQTGVFKKQSKVFDEKSEELSKELSKVYTQFVTILGIFTAIVVSVFGGLSIVSGVFDKINETPMWKLILTGSMVSIFVLCLIFLLTRWISTIVRKAFNHEAERSLFQIITNNGAFSIGIFIFSYLIFVSVILSSNSTTIKLKDIINSNDSIPAIITLITIPILAFALITINTLIMRKK